MDAIPAAPPDGYAAKTGSANGKGVDTGSPIVDAFVVTFECPGE